MVLLASRKTLVVCWASNPPCVKHLVAETSTQTSEGKKGGQPGGQPGTEATLLLMTSRDESQEEVSVPTVTGSAQAMSENGSVKCANDV